MQVGGSHEIDLRCRSASPPALLALALVALAASDEAVDAESRALFVGLRDKLVPVWDQRVADAAKRSIADAERLLAPLTLAPIEATETPQTPPGRTGHDVLRAPRRARRRPRTVAA